ncbi:uncharacterized protein RHO25_008241 [Cercospora beticola]|uniref:Uncharacterized protein n=1 Tax=Cercospora beticola TaxID=122368 RepID=A0ABZ0NVQ3_CERBT|nr:hypothetical protein RHO25_008241 [Cercospora beticola]CAK1357655.1 unnamed protein product [Cercospora beticola]
MAMDPTVTVLIVIVAAAAAVVLGWASTRFFIAHPPTRDTENAGNEPSQAQYMREVRLRNTEVLARQYGYGPRDLGQMRAASYTDQSD